MVDTVYAQWTLDAPVLSLCLNRRGDFVAAACADGVARLFPASDEAIRPVDVPMHQGAFSLAPDADAHAFLSAGTADGRLLILDPVMKTSTLLDERVERGLSGVASTPCGERRAYVAGQEIVVLNDEGTPVFHAPFSGALGGVSFSPDGRLFAASYDGGASVWSMDDKQPKPRRFVGQGTALPPVWGDGFLLAFMQDGHAGGWMLNECQMFLLPGYATPSLSVGFSSCARFLVTSGAEQALCWERTMEGFVKTALRLGAPDTRLVSFVAPHPSDSMVAVGYDDGLVVLAPLDGRREIVLLPPCGKPVRGLVWNGAGDALFAALDPDAVLLFTLKSVRKAFSHAR